MQKDSRILDDFARLAAGAAGSLLDIRREIEAMVAAKMDKILAKTHAVSREEFEAVKAMAAKAREENEMLKDRLAKLEGK